ncbi:trimeric LpxA-like protein [Hyaloraphidium curvatum]|nr:trimeric LpxA-like protein [Hyaloraphidium curvatum]
MASCGTVPIFGDAEVTSSTALREDVPLPRPPNMRAVLLRCGGAQAGVIWDVVGGNYAEAVSAERAAVWDDEGAVHRGVAHLAHLRTPRDAAAFLAKHDGADVFVCNGDPAVRAALVDELRGLASPLGVPLAFPNAVHRTASISQSAELGEGIFLSAYSVVGPHAKVGSFCMVNTLAGCDHDCVMEPYSQLNGAGGLAGSVRLGRGSVVATGATVRNGARIADWVTVGMNAAVTGDIKVPGSTWVGVPATMVQPKKGKPVGGRGMSDGSATRGNL